MAAVVDDLRDVIERDFVVERTGWAAERAARVTERLQRDVAPVDRLESLVVWWSAHNAFTTFGRTIYLSRRLFERLPDDDAVAFVIAHELAHHRLGHIPTSIAARLLPARIALALLDVLLCTTNQEADADKLAIEMCLAVGYDLDRCLVALEILALISLDYGDVDGVIGGERGDASDAGGESSPCSRCDAGRASRPSRDARARRAHAGDRAVRSAPAAPDRRATPRCARSRCECGTVSDRARA